MNTQWSFHSPVKIHLADNVLDRIGEHVRYERTVLLTTAGAVRRGTVKRVEASMGDRSVSVRDFVQPNPDIDNIDAHLYELVEDRPDAIIALGGGSVIDTAKAMARLMSNGGISLSDHLRDGVPFRSPADVPIIAIPTTSGTGAEVTPFGTIWDNRAHVKRSVEGPDILPEMALLDPLLTVGLPADITLSTGLDVVSHSLESIWNNNANPISIALATGSLGSSLEDLDLLVREPSNIKARRSMMVASTMAGMAIAQTRTALAHSMSYPLTAELDVPHGLACGFMLPEVLEFNSASDDGRLNRLANELGYRSIEDLRNGLSSFLDRTGADRMMLDIVKSAGNVLSRRAKMINPSRASCNLREAAMGDIDAILDRWKRRVEG